MSPSRKHPAPQADHGLHPPDAKGRIPDGRKRRALSLLLILTVPVLGLMLGAAAAGPSGPRIVDNDAGTRISMTIPGFLIRAAGRWIPDAPEEARALSQHVRGLRLDIREGGYHPGFEHPEAGQAAFARTLAQRERNGYTPLMRVESADEHIAIDAVMDRKDRIRRLAVLADDGESFVHVQLRTKIGAAQMGDLLESAGFGADRLGLELGNAADGSVHIDTVQEGEVDLADAAY